LDEIDHFFILIINQKHMPENRESFLEKLSPEERKKYEEATEDLESGAAQGLPDQEELERFDNPPTDKKEEDPTQE
jgi:hypothetical protein